MTANRRALHRTHCIDPGLVIAIALALVAAAPFLTRPGLPHGTDAELHVYRAAELGHALAEGSGYLRWAPDLYLGYGYPIFNYYAPFTYYLACAFDLFPGMDIVAGVKAVFVLGLFLAAVGSYLLGKALVGPKAGVVAAALYTFSPYVVLIDPHARGDLAEHFAICLLPMLFYGFHNLLTGVGGKGSFLLSVLSLSATVFSHNLLGLVASGMVLAYWLWTVVFKIAPASSWRGPAAFALAAGLIGFFWVPMLLEQNAVQLSVIGPGHFDFHQHFLSLGELLAPSPILDLGASAPRYAFNLGLPQWPLALIGVRGLLLSRKRRELLFFFVAALVLILLVLPISTRLWELIPWMTYLQFPWRLLGPVALMLAVCGAASCPVLQKACRSDVPIAASLALILGLALPVLYPPIWDADFGGTAPQDIIYWELSSQALGTTATGDFVPQGAALVQMRPVDSLVSSYSEPGPVDKVNRASLPAGATVTILEHGPLHDRLLVEMPERFILRIFTFYFPGWRAYVDGEQVPIEVAKPEGFITLWVPEGQHEVLIRFEDTPARQIGWVMTGLGIVGLVTVLLVAPLMPSYAVRPGEAHELCSSPLSYRNAALLLGVVVTFAIVKSGLVDRHDDWMRYTSPPGEARAAQYQVHVNFNNEIELIGYDLPKTRVSSGATVPVVLYWRALRSPDANYQTFVHLTNPPDILWGQEDHLNPGGFPTKRWKSSYYVWDEYEVAVLPGTPPGEYQLNVGLYSLEQGFRLDRIDSDGNVVGDAFALGSVVIERPRRQPSLEQLDMGETAMVSFPDCGLTLLGFTLSQPTLEVPGQVQITLFWRAETSTPACQGRRLVLADADGAIVAESSGLPGGYPMNLWQRNDIIRDPLNIAVRDPSIQEGVYNIGIDLHSSGEGVVYAGSLNIRQEMLPCR